MMQYDILSKWTGGEEVGNILDEFYRKPAYFELIIELEEKLKNVPLEIEKLQIEYYKRELSMLGSYLMEDDKKETIEKIKDLKEDELDYKQMIHQIKEKYGALYDDECEEKNEKPNDIVKTAMKKKLFRRKDLFE